MAICSYKLMQIKHPAGVFFSIRSIDFVCHLTVIDEGEVLLIIAITRPHKEPRRIRRQAPFTIF